MVDFTNGNSCERADGFMTEAQVDVNELIQKYSIEQLNEAAEQYWLRMTDSTELLAKPVNFGEVRHLLVQFAHMVGGLEVYPGMTVLEFGAGSCWSSRMLNQLGMKVISADVSPTALEIGKSLRKRYPPIGTPPDHEFLLLDGRKIDLPDESVDRIWCFDALHHVPSQEATLKEMARVLKRGGLAGFCEPGPNHSKGPLSQFEMKNFTVIENDIDLGWINSTANQFGFTEMKVAVSLIHPIMVKVEDLPSFFSRPEDYANATAERVTNYPIFFLYKGKPDALDSRAVAGLIGSISVDSKEIVLRSGEEVRFSVTAENTGSHIWLPSGGILGSVNLGGFLFSLSDKTEMPRPREVRFGISDKHVYPGQTVSASVLLGAPEAGSYRLDLDP